MSQCEMPKSNTQNTYRLTEEHSMHITARRQHSSPAGKPNQVNEAYNNNAAAEPVIL